MRLPILLIALVSSTVAQQNAQRSARTPQAQIRYQDPSGLKVDWKLFSRQTQSHLQSLQHSQQQRSAASAHQAQDQSAHPEQQMQRQPQQSQLVHIEPQEVQYKPYLQPQTQQAARPDITQVQYQSYIQSQAQAAQPDPDQMQYVQHQAPIEAHPNPNQIQYNPYVPAQAPSEAQSNLLQVQYKAYPHPQVSAEAQPDQNQIHYRRLQLEDYKPQRPHAEQSAVQYASNIVVPQDQQQANVEVPQYEQQESYEQTEQQKSRRDYSNSGFQGKIVYKDEYDQQQQQEQYQQQVAHVQVPIEKLPAPPPQKLVFNKDLPKEIQELLQFQAEIPYNVIANTISYKPKMFVPSPLPPETKGPYNYRSKIYYLNNDQYEPDFEATKPVEEEQS